jgi:predicted porin
LSFLGRSQIARTFGTARKLGVRGRGEYSLIDYDFGVYSSDTYFQEFFPGTEFVGWVNFKPLGKTDGRYGRLKIGGGMQAGKRDNNYCVTGAYLGYEYKKVTAEFEWSHANGYNGTLGRSVTDHASGFYATLGYMITKKLQALICYDQFDPDTHVNGNKRREYVVGLNYFIKGQALRLIFNYAFCQNDGGKDSHRLMFGTQILI